MDDRKILYLSGNEVSALGAGDMNMALRDVEQALKLVYQRDAIVPEKIAMRFGRSFAEESTKGRINAMPGFLGGSYQMAGIKWIGSNPKNLAKGLPRASCLTVLNDPDSKFPLCVMNGSEISAVRTGASSGVAAKYLARKDPETLLLVGAGYQNRTQLEAIYCACPQLKYFYVVDIVEETAQRFAREMGEKLKIEITPVTSIAQVDRTADISVNASSAPVPVMDLSVARPGSLHICVGGLDHPDLYKKADKIFCDSWAQVRHRGSCYLALDGQSGAVRDEDIYTPEIGAIICGDKPGRESNSEFLYYKPVGMGIMDIAIASRIYRRAKEQKIGTWLAY